MLGEQRAVTVKMSERAKRAAARLKIWNLPNEE